MIPVLYPAAETEFTTNGIGFLSDAISCKVYREINGGYELTMQYPVSGAHYSDISLRSIIKVKPDKVSDPQALRIYRITKPFRGVVTVYARHLVYDLSGTPVSPFTANGVAAAMVALKNNAAVDCPFEFLTTKSGGGTMTVSAPASLWSRLGGTSGSVLDVYGGEYSYDNYKVTLNTRLGSNNGVVIRYGKNLTDLEQDANCANCYTGVYPYWQLEDELVTLPEKIVYADGNFDYVKILPLDLSEKFETAPTEEQLRTAAVNYIENNNIGVPDVSWKVEFVALEDTEEYRGMGVLERISLGDTVTVEFEKLGVDASARAVAVEYDCLLERYDSIMLGRVKSNIADTIAEQKKEIEGKPSKSLVEKISDNLTAAITGANGGAVRLIDTNNDGRPDTLYIADNPDPAQAVKVWRFNYEGWAASSNGYNGPFIMGATLDDGLLANFVTAANLRAGTIQSESGDFMIDLSNGTLKTVKTKIFRAADYTETDRATLLTLISGTAPTDEQMERYDFTQSGKLEVADYELLVDMLNNGNDLAVEWGVEIAPVANAKESAISVYVSFNGEVKHRFSASTSGVSAVRGDFENISGNLEQDATLGHFNLWQGYGGLAAYAVPASYFASQVYCKNVFVEETSNGMIVPFDIDNIRTVIAVNVVVGSLPVTQRAAGESATNSSYYAAFYPTKTGVELTLGDSYVGKNAYVTVYYTRNGD